MNNRIYISLIAVLALSSMPALAMEHIAKENLEKKFIEAARGGDLEAVQRFIQNDVDVNAQHSFRDTALILAADNGREKVVKCLIQAGADVNLINQNGYNALISAVDRDYLAMPHKEIIKSLIMVGADLNTQNSWGLTALMKAGMLGDQEIVQRLLEAGADLSIENNYGQSALFRAAEWDQKPCCELLVEAMLGLSSSKQACAAYFCMKNIAENIFDGIKIPLCQRLSAPNYLGPEKTFEEILKIKNNRIKRVLINKYFLDEEKQN